METSLSRRWSDGATATGGVAGAYVGKLPLPDPILIDQARPPDQTRQDKTKQTHNGFDQAWPLSLPWMGDPASRFTGSSGAPGPGETGHLTLPVWIGRRIAGSPEDQKRMLLGSALGCEVQLPYVTLHLLKISYPGCEAKDW